MQLTQEIDEPPSIIVDVIIKDKQWHDDFINEIDDIENWMLHIVKSVISFEKVEYNQIEIAVLLTNDVEIQQLNNDFRHKNKPTNVLSFPAEVKGNEVFPIINNYIDIPDMPYSLGDVVMSLDSLKREAREQGKTLINHTTHILIHGIMHLLGYDHIMENERKEMESKEIIILKSMGIGNPYE